MALNRIFVEPMTGIEPAYSAWEADVLPLNYIGAPGKSGPERLASGAGSARRALRRAVGIDPIHELIPARQANAAIWLCTDSWIFEVYYFVIGP
jgi:hypothetical protein